MKQPFFVTHYSDWAAKQDASSTKRDIINNGNIFFARLIKRNKDG
jgi:hypothetical protein